MQDFLKKIKSAYPEFVFKPGKRFLFRPKNTIFYDEDAEYFELLLLHELGHALLGHYDFATGLSRLKMECAAWDKARSLAEQFDVDVYEDVIQDKIETYREWLHDRLICPDCGLIRLETKDQNFICPRCNILLKKSDD